MLWLEHSGHSRCCVWWVRERDQKTGGVQTEGVFFRREAAGIAPEGVHFARG